MVAVWWMVVLCAVVVAALLSGTWAWAAKKAGYHVPWSWRLLSGMTIVGLAVAIYAWRGSPQGGDHELAAAGSTVASNPAMGQGAVPPEMILGMVKRLEDRLKEHPDDPRGWAMLGRSYRQLGNYESSAHAYEQALQRVKTEPQLWVDAADALAMANHRNLSGKPREWLEQALKLDPDNLQALVLLGTEAFVQKDFKASVNYWEHGLKLAQQNNAPEIAQALEGSLAEAKAKLK